MDWAPSTCSEKVFPLSVAQVTGERERRTQAIDTCALLTRVALQGNLDAFYRNIFAFRVPKNSQRRSGAQRRIVEVMGIGSRSVAAFLDTEIARKFISTDVDLVPHRGLQISNDSNCHNWGSSSLGRMFRAEIRHASHRPWPYPPHQFHFAPARPHRCSADRRKRSAGARRWRAAGE